MSDDEREREEHIQQLKDWVAPAEQRVSYDLNSDGKMRDLSNAIYTMGERYLLGGIEGVDLEDALRIWAIVETVRTEGFPTQLRI